MRSLTMLAAMAALTGPSEMAYFQAILTELMSTNDTDSLLDRPARKYIAFEKGVILGAIFHNTPDRRDIIDGRAISAVARGGGGHL